MNPQLARALETVLSDLRAESAPIPELRDDDWGSLPRQETVVLLAADGSAQGVSCLTDDAPAEQLRSVADQVQEWAHEEMGRLEVPVAWPRCLAHPQTHPLTAVVVDESAWWECPVDHRQVSLIGHLGVAARSSRRRRGGR